MTCGKSLNPSEPPHLRTFSRRQSPPGIGHSWGPSSVSVLIQASKTPVSILCHPFHSTKSVYQCLPSWVQGLVGPPLPGQGHSPPAPTLPSPSRASHYREFSSSLKPIMPLPHIWAEAVYAVTPTRLEGWAAVLPDCRKQGRTGGWKEPGWSSRNTSCRNS